MCKQREKIESGSFFVETASSERLLKMPKAISRPVCASQKRSYNRRGLRSNFEETTLFVMLMPIRITLRASKQHEAVLTPSPRRSALRA
jgi:hypothetical protein